MGVAGLKVGIVWQGNRGFQDDSTRSVPLARLEPLARVPGVRLVSLQKGYGSEQLRDAGDWNVIDLGNRLDSFLDTAAVMQHLDLVISVDTAVAHLAGALGVPVWIALPTANDWRWLERRDDSPWYPTARLSAEAEARYRQCVPLMKDSADLCNHMGIALLGQAKHAEAESALRRGLRLRPDHPEAHNNLGVVFDELVHGAGPSADAGSRQPAAIRCLSLAET